MNRKTIYKQLLATVLWLASLSLVTAVHASNILEDISFASIPGDKVQVVLKFSETAPEPGTFTIDSPARIILDFPDTSTALSQKRQKIGIGLAQNVTAVTAGGRTRVVLSMVSLTKFSTEIEGNKVAVILDEANITRTSDFLSRNSITDIDFKLGKEGEGNIILHFKNPPKGIDLERDVQKLKINIDNVILPDHLERRLDVADFKTPVSLIDTFATGKNIKMLVDTNGEFDHLGYQAGNTFIIEVKGLTKAQKEAKEKAKFGYIGERLSLNFQDIEVRAVLQLIADFTGKNMVTSDTVGGSITLRLKNVPWDQALDIILKTKGLGMREEGNVMRVAPAEELAAIEKAQAQANKEIEELEPLTSAIIKLRYIPAESAVTLLTGLTDKTGTGAGDTPTGGTAGTSTQFNTRRSAGGTGFRFRAASSIVADTRTNQLIVRDTAGNIEQLRELLKIIDVPTKQVLIDSRIVSASDKFERDMGLNWSFGSTDSSGNLKNRGFPSTTQTTDATVDLGIKQKNLLGVTFALLNSSYLVDLEISASQIEGTSELISSPRVVTSNGDTAKIKSGNEVPYLEQNENGNTVAFKDAVLSLDVTPNILPGNRVFMELKINKDEVDELVPIGIGSAPSIATKEIETNVLVDNGDTVVLGGIFEHNVSQSLDSVPILGDIPVIGQAFKVDNRSDDKTELIIFITPKILDSSLSTR